jgi:hypothetical protein
MIAYDKLEEWYPKMERISKEFFEGKNSIQFLI